MSPQLSTGWNVEGHSLNMYIKYFFNRDLIIGFKIKNHGFTRGILQVCL